MVYISKALNLTNILVVVQLYCYVVKLWKLLEYTTCGVLPESSDF
jgi:hypothetical protein